MGAHDDGARPALAREATTTASAAFERDARRWLRAYPPRWRARREGEVLGLLADLAPADATRLSASERWGLVRQGIATRFRDRPPVSTWFGYRCLERRIPRRWAAWAADDIAGAGYPVRSYVGSIWLLAVVYSVVPELRSAWFLAVLGGLAVLSAVLWPEAQRRRARVKHLVPRPGDPVTQGSHVLAPAPRVRVSAVSGWATTAAVAAVLLAGGTASALVAPASLAAVPDGYVTPEGRTEVAFDVIVAPVPPGVRAALIGLVAVALVVGLAWGALAVRRLRRLVPRCPEQPHRVVRPVSAAELVSVGTLLAMGVAVAVVELTGTLVVGLGPLLAAVGAVVLPVALVVLAAARRPGAAGLAAVDLRRIVFSGRLPDVDPVAERLVPVTVTVPGQERPPAAALG